MSGCRDEQPWHGHRCCVARRCRARYAHRHRRTDRSARCPPTRWAVLLRPRAEAGGLRASAPAHLPSRRLDCWTGVERRRTGDMQRGFSESIHPSGSRRIASSVGTATSGPRRASRPASISRWLWSRRTMDLRSPRAWPSTSSSTIVAMADNRNSQRPSIWRQRTTGSLRL